MASRIRLIATKLIQHLIDATIAMEYSNGKKVTIILINSNVKTVLHVVTFLKNMVS